MFSNKVLTNYENQETEKDRIIKTALDYLLSEMGNTENQLNYLINGQNIVLDEKQLNEFKKNFVLILSKIFPKNDGSINLWTANEKVFDRFQTDSYLRQIMKDSKLPLEVLPAMINMNIDKDGVIVEDVMGSQQIYSHNSIKK